MWMTSCTGSARGGFWGFWKKSVELSSWLGRRRLTFASSGAHVVWGRWKSQVYLSPYVEKPLNSKVIKSFVPELRSRKCFSYFGIPVFYVYMLWTFYVCFAYSYLAIVQIYRNRQWSFSLNTITQIHMRIYICKYTNIFSLWVESSPMARETGVQSQVESYQIFKKWYLITPCLTLNIIRYILRLIK